MTNIFQSLAIIFNFTILIYYHFCQQKMDFCRESIGDDSSNRKAYTAHHNPTNQNEDG